MSFIPFFIYLFIKKNSVDPRPKTFGSCCYALHSHPPTSKLGPWNYSIFLSSAHKEFPFGSAVFISANLFEKCSALLPIPHKITKQYSFFFFIFLLQ